MAGSNARCSFEKYMDFLAVFFFSILAKTYMDKMTKIMFTRRALFILWLGSRKIMKTSGILITGASALLALAVSSCASHNAACCTAQPATTTATAPPTVSAAAPAPASTMTPPPVAAAAPAATVAVNTSAVQVSLASDFNDQGIYLDGAQFSGGIDRDGYACSSNLLGAALSWSGVPFQLGSAINGSNIVTCAGQTISLPAGNFSKLKMLAIAVNGPQDSQNFTVTYADNSSQTNTQTFSDWVQSDSNTGESPVTTMEYRDQSDGTKDQNPYNIYGYSFDLNPAKGVQSLMLPDNNNLKVFALTLVP